MTSQSLRVGVRERERERAREERSCREPTDLPSLGLQTTRPPNVSREVYALMGFNAQPAGEAAGEAHMPLRSLSHESSLAAVLMRPLPNARPRLLRVNANTSYDELRVWAKRSEC